MTALMYWIVSLAIDRYGAFGGPLGGGMGKR